MVERTVQYTTKDISNTLHLCPPAASSPCHLPVGPVMTVNSPRRCPFNILFIDGNVVNCLPAASNGFDN